MHLLAESRYGDGTIGTEVEEEQIEKPLIHSGPRSSERDTTVAPLVECHELDDFRVGTNIMNIFFLSGSLPFKFLLIVSFEVI